MKINNVTFDTMIATYLLDYVVKEDISFVARSFDYDIRDYEDLYGTDKKPKLIDEETLKQVCCQKSKQISNSSFPYKFFGGSVFSGQTLVPTVLFWL